MKNQSEAAAGETAGMLNQIVVLDTAGPIVYLGTLRRVGADGFALEEVDVHDCREGHANKELYICESRRDGVRVNRKRVLVFRETVLSISLLEDVIPE